MTDTHLDLAGIKARAEAAPLGPWAGSTCSTTLALVAEVERLTADLARTDAILRDYMVIGSVETFRAALAPDGES